MNLIANWLLFVIWTSTPSLQSFYTAPQLRGREAGDKDCLCVAILTFLSKNAAIAPKFLGCCENFSLNISFSSSVHMFILCLSLYSCIASSTRPITGIREKTNHLLNNASSEYKEWYEGGKIGNNTKVILWPGKNIPHVPPSHFFSFL